MKKSVLSTLALAASMATVANAALADGAAKFVGNITVNGSIPGNFGNYWNQITAENECKWASIEGTRGKYNWSGCDAAYNWAQKNGAHFKFHALVWGSQYPSWLNNLSTAETKEAITAWFDAVKAHYPNLEMIDVVNEAIRGDKYAGEYKNAYHSCYTTVNQKSCGNSNNKIMEALGGDNGKYDFVTEAFRMARERWPKAILIYNDYNTVQYNLDQGIDLIQKIKANGASVDAYGLQAHDMQGQSGYGGAGGGGPCIDKQQLIDALDKIHSETGLPLFISEYDISTTDDDLQKKCYSEQIPVFMEAQYVAGITLWGYIYGSTWQNCNNTASGCSGIIKDNTDRAAMKWLKEYLATNTGKNTTGLATGVATPPEPQKPFNATNTPWAVPGKIEAEDFDITGVGINDDGTSNVSYSDKDSENHGKSNYRADAPEVDIYEKPFGTVIGYNDVGEWYEYTINVKEAGDYTLFAAVASANNTNSFKFSLDGKDLTDELTAPKATKPDSYEEFDKISANVNIAKTGKHVLRLTVTGAWFDIDYFNFVKGKNAQDDAPLSSSSAENSSSSPATSSTTITSSSSENSSSSTNGGNSSAVDNGSSNSVDNGSSTSIDSGSSASVDNGSSASIADSPATSGSTAPTFSSPSNGNATDVSTDAIFGNLHLGNAATATYDVYDLRGQRLARFTAHDMTEATQMWKNGLVKGSSNTKGIVFIHSRHNGEIVQVKSIR